MERIKKSDLVILAIVASFLLLYNLGTGSLTSWDEAVYAQVSREMLVSGNWLDLSWMGQAWSDKPPLYMWMTVIFYKLFGINELSARLFSALCSIGTVLVTYLFSLKLYSRRSAFITCLLLLSTSHFIWSSRVGMLDAALTFFVVLSLYLFKLGEENKKYLFFSACAFAAAFLTKGAGALLIPIIISLYLICKKDFAILKQRSFIVGAVVALLLIGFWHAIALRHYGKDFIANYFVKHMLTRTTQAMEGHTGGVWTYFKVLPNKGRPWGALGLLMLSVVAYRTIVKKEKKHLLPLLYSITVLVIFSVTKTKLHWYIIPIYPAFMMMTGFVLEKIFRSKSVLIVSLLFLISISYLAFDKKIFNLDYTPQTKRFALTICSIVPKGEKVILYDISDPALQFYCADFSRNVLSSTPVNDVFNPPNRYILMNQDAFGCIVSRKVVTVISNSDFVLLKRIAD